MIMSILYVKPYEIQLKAVLRENFITWNSFIGKRKESIKNNKLSVYFS